MDRSGQSMVIVNPSSGPQDGDTIVEQVTSVIEAMPEEERPTLRITRGAGDASGWAKDAHGEGFERIVAVGGDGTVMECAQGAVDSGADLAVGVVPTGTANVLARVLSLPLDLKPALQRALKGPTRAFDFGTLPEHGLAFLVGVGIGVPGQMVEKVEPGIKDTLGPAAYFTAFFEGLIESRSAVFDVTIDEETLVTSGHSAVVANVGRFAEIGNLSIGPDISPHDGQADVFVLDHTSPGGVFEIVKSFFGGDIREQDGFTHRQGRKIRIETQPPLSVQVDGEWIGRTPVTVELTGQTVSLVHGEDYSPTSDADGEA